MRIIGGKYKGRKIVFVKSKITRPLRDSVKENIFNVICHSKKLKIKLDKANILDIYSGIGSFGLECISRGANKVTFVEKDLIAKKILKKNLDYLSANDKAIIIDDINDLKNFSKKEKFNLFFFDPPYKDNFFIENIKMIWKNNLFDDSNFVIVHRDRKSIDNYDKNFKILFCKIYGRSKIIFGRLAK